MKSLILALGILIVSGCTGTQNRFTSSKKGHPRSSIKVNLPPRPNLDVRHPPKHYLDGSYSVEGLIEDLKKTRGKVVKLTGYIRSLNLCPKNEETVCNIEPSATLADFPSGPSRKIQIFAKDEGGLQILEGLAVGLKVTFKGRPAIISPKGTVIEPQGLLVIETEKKD